jgi:hypothetical protein
MDIIIKVGFLISYDYMYLKESLPRIYKDADLIVLAIDKDGKTWSGEDISIPESLFEWVEKYDVDNKIKIYKDSFYVPKLSPIEADTRERNLLAQFMGDGGWHIQIDTDEYFFDFSRVVDYLRSLDFSKPYLIYGKWFPLFKEDHDGYYIVESTELFPFATNRPNYTLARFIESEAYSHVYADFPSLHQTWARSEEEIYFKIKNWGHARDFDVDSYFKMWQIINKTTYKYIKSFHMLSPWVWKSLVFIEEKNISVLIDKMKERELEKEKLRISEEQIKVKDFIPVVLYKIKSKLLKKKWFSWL